MTSLEIHNVSPADNGPNFTRLDADVIEHRQGKSTVWAVTIKWERVTEGWKILGD
jgi:hypothetical protein